MKPLHYKFTAAWLTNTGMMWNALCWINSQTNHIKSKINIRLESLLINHSRALGYNNQPAQLMRRMRENKK